MPVALVDFEAEYGGELVAVSRGEYVAEGHELASLHPHKFSSSARGGGKRRADRSAAPRTRTRSTGSTPPTSSPGVAVFLSDWARESIAYDVGRMEGDFLECGGCLLGRSSGPGRITVEVAGATSDYVGRGSNFIETNLSGYETLARSYADLGLRWLGGWHSHPGETHARASTADRENWAGNRSYLGHDYVGLIAIPREWGEIALRAWVATANGVELASLVD